ncbi:MAG: hypothetical protein WCO44_16170 [Bacteroidota bacterium]
MVYVESGCTRRTGKEHLYGNQEAANTEKSQPVKKKGVTDTISILDCSWYEIICFNGKLKTTKTRIPFRTNFPADSISWRLWAASPGILMEPVSGKGNCGMIALMRDSCSLTGELILAATPYKSGFISKTAKIRILADECIAPICDQIRNEPADGQRSFPRNQALRLVNKHGFAIDTSDINRVRRQIISEFRELLYMYTRTNSQEEKNYFRYHAEKTLKEIPGVKTDISPACAIRSVFEDPDWANAVVLPLYNDPDCVIVGIRLRQK